MTKQEFFEKMIEIQEERNSLIEKALFPMGVLKNSVFEEMVHLMVDQNKCLFDISQSGDIMNETLERLTDKIKKNER